MDLSKIGKLLCNLRKANGMTQKELADKLGVVPKTVSKWETGNGFPDVTTLSALADVLGVSERIILSGNLIQNTEESGNMKKTKFYVCPNCGSVMQGMGGCQVTCCGKPLESARAKIPDEKHSLKISEIEDDFYIEFDHEMRKEHYISFLSYIRFDRVFTVKLYPEQDAAVRIPKMYGGKIIYYCNQDGLFEYQINSR